MTQAKLLDIAIREFGLKGIEGASTRGIAAAAGTAMSSITYHYGGKDGLYLAAADHIVQGMADEMASALADGCTLDASDTQVARAAIHGIVMRLADKMLRDDSADWSLFILREQMNPGEAFDRIYAGMMGQLLRAVTTLVTTVTGAPPRKARIATMTLFGQALAVRTARASLLRLLEQPTLDDATRLDLKARITANIDAILDRMTAEERP